MVDIDINVNIDEAEEGLGRTFPGWPDIEDRPGGVPACEFTFYNLGTRPDPENDGEWLDCDDIFETDKKVLGTMNYTLDDGRLNINHRYGFEGGKPLITAIISQHELAAPERAVLAKAQSIQRDPKHRGSV